MLNLTTNLVHENPKIEQVITPKSLFDFDKSDPPETSGRIQGKTLKRKQKSREKGRFRDEEDLESTLFLY